MRTPVGLGVSSNPRAPGTVVYVLCNDGSTWRLENDKWVEISPVPGSLREISRKNDNQVKKP